MKEIEKMYLFKERGFTCNPETGELFGITGRKIIRKNNNGYIRCCMKNEGKNIEVLGHRLIWFLINNELPDELDHINRIREDNRLENLRNGNRQQNQWNREAKGYTETKNGTFRSQISVNGKCVDLKTYKTKEEAYQVYLDAKKIYHK